MPLVVIIGGSPSSVSRSLGVVHHVGELLVRRGFDVEFLQVRDLDPADLLHGRVESPSIREAIGLVERADGVAVVTPVYKASYTGLVKSFLDLLPQLGLARKVVLPLAVGGTLAHVLAIDYALRPVLASLGAMHVVNGLFLLDKTIAMAQDGSITIEADVAARLLHVVGQFATSLDLHGHRFDEGIAPRAPDSGV